MDSPNKTLILKYELKGHILNYLFLSVMDALALSEHELGFSEHETFLDVQVRVSCQSKTEFCGL